MFLYEAISCYTGFEIALRASRWLNTPLVIARSFFSDEAISYDTVFEVASCLAMTLHNSRSLRGAISATKQSHMILGLRSLRASRWRNMPLVIANVPLWSNLMLYWVWDRFVPSDDGTCVSSLRGAFSATKQSHAILCLRSLRTSRWRNRRLVIARSYFSNEAISY